MDQTLHLPSSRPLLQCYIGGRPCNKPQHVKFETKDMGFTLHEAYKKFHEAMIKCKPPRRTERSYKLIIRYRVKVLKGFSDVQIEIQLTDRKFALKMARSACKFIRQQKRQHVRFKVSRSRVRNSAPSTPKNLINHT